MLHKLWRTLSRHRPQPSSLPGPLTGLRPLTPPLLKPPALPTLADVAVHRAFTQWAGDTDATWSAYIDTLRRREDVLRRDIAAYHEEIQKLQDFEPFIP